jgi:hypothetical protein
VADDTRLNLGSGGDLARSLEDAGGVKWFAGVTAYATTLGSPDVLQVVTPANGLPVQQQTGATWAVSLASTTVTGTVAVTQSGTWTVGVSGAVAVTGTFWQATQPVSIASTVTVTGSGGTFPVTDSGGSLTVDAPVGTPVFVRLSDGTSAITTLPVSLASVPSHAVTNAGTFAVQVTSAPTTTVTGTVALGAGSAAVGTVTAVGAAAHDAAASGNPVRTAGTAANGAPSNNAAVAAGDVCQIATTTRGAQWVVLSGGDGSAVSVNSGELSVVTSALSSVKVAAIGEGDGGAYPLAGTYITVDGIDCTLLWNNLRNSSGTEIASRTTTPGASDLGLVVREAGLPATMATAAAVVVGTTASGTLIVAARAGRRAVILSNETGTQNVRIGPSGVSATVGYLWKATDGPLVLPGGAAVYGFRLVADQSVSYVEVY